VDGDKIERHGLTTDEKGRSIRYVVPVWQPVGTGAEEGAERGDQPALYGHAGIIDVRI
jgi:hypothetical protein